MTRNRFSWVDDNAIEVQAANKDREGVIICTCWHQLFGEWVEVIENERVNEQKEKLFKRKFKKWILVERKAHRDKKAHTLTGIVWN